MSHHCHESQSAGTVLAGQWGMRAILKIPDSNLFSTKEGKSNFFLKVTRNHSWKGAIVLSEDALSAMPGLWWDCFQVVVITTDHTQPTVGSSNQFYTFSLSGSVRKEP